MKTKKKLKAPKNDSEILQKDDDDISGLISSIHDDGGDFETGGLGDGDDVPTAEISDVIKKLKLDRFKDMSTKTKKKPLSKQGKDAGQQNTNKQSQDRTKKENKSQNVDNLQKEDKLSRESKILKDKTSIKDNSSMDSSASRKKNKKNRTQKKKQNEDSDQNDNCSKDDPNQKKDKAVNNSAHASSSCSMERETQKKQKQNGHRRKEKRTESSVERSSVKEKSGKTVQKEQSKKEKRIGASLSLELPKTSTMLLPSGVKWFSIQEGLKSEGSHVSSEEVISSYLDYATKLYDQEVELYAAKKSGESGSQSRWMQTVAKSGALSDKVAALTLEVQRAPIHTPLSLDALLAMVRKKGRREALIGLDATKRLFLEELLPSNRKLKSFSQHSFEELEKRCGNDKASRDKQILLWFFEDQLKQKYATIIDFIEKMLQDTLSAIKAKALSCCYELIVNRPEEEKRLLRLIVNKVGDPDYKVAAKAVHWLQKLVDVHSMMKIVVVQAVEELLFRPNINAKAQYYAICFLNQIVLHPEESQLATQLIIVYLSFFKACTKQKKIDNKMLSAVITGVHRAFPYSVEDEKVHEQLDTLLKVVHQTSFNTSVQALLLIKQVLDKRQSTMDRFYSALYRKLLDPHLSSSNRHAMFLNLLYQTLKSDDVLNRIKAFVKRLLQVCSWQQPPFIAAVLVLVSELIRAKPSLGKLNSWNDDDDEDEHFMDVDEEDASKDGEGDNDGKSETSSNSKEAKPGSKDKPSWVHRPIRSADKEGVSASYDPLARNPLHSHVDSAVMWELEVLSNHFHPSVALFASQLLAGSLVSYTGNPLQDFTSGRFLERFVYKNPKQKLIGKESVMQPKSRSYKPPAIRSMAVNSKGFTSLTEENVPIDEMFFHRFFAQKGKKEKKVKDKKKDNKADGRDDEGKMADEEEEDEDEEMTDNITSNIEMDNEGEFDSDASSVGDEEFDRILDEMEDDIEDEDDEDIDFAGEFQKKSSKKPKKRKGQEDGSSSDDDEEEEDDDDIGEDEDDEEIGESADLEGLDEEAFEMSDEDEEVPPVKAHKRKQKQGKKNAKKQRKDLGDVTEQISSMIDENVGSKFDVGLNALANKDKADMKQLRWEMDRDRWVRGVDSRSKVRAKKLQKGPKAKGFKGQGKKRKR